MQPTKLPDELFPDDEWQRADYGQRVAFLVQAVISYRSSARMWAQRHEMLADELRAVREVNAQLALDLERTGEVNARLLRELSDALSRIETQK